jgi:hypothetical protein
MKKKIKKVLSKKKKLNQYQKEGILLISIFQLNIDLVKTG